MTEQKNYSPEDQANQLIEALSQSTAAQIQMAQAVLALAEQVAQQNEINAALLDVIADDGEGDDIPQTLTLNQRRQ